MGRLEVRVPVYCLDLLSYVLGWMEFQASLSALGFEQAFRIDVEVRFVFDLLLWFLSLLMYVRLGICIIGLSMPYPSIPMSLLLGSCLVWCRLD